jgi:hypothetical protein
MKRLVIWALALGMLAGVAALALAADDYLSQQGFYIGKDFPAEQVIAHNYQAAWLDARNKLQLRKVVKVLGKEKLELGEAQYKVYLHYQRHDRPEAFQDDILVKRLDTDIWVMTDRSGNPDNNSQVLSRVMKNPTP